MAHVFSIVLFAALWVGLAALAWLTAKVIRRLESTRDHDGFHQGL